MLPENAELIKDMTIPGGGRAWAQMYPPPWAGSDVRLLQSQRSEVGVWGDLSREIES